MSSSPMKNLHVPLPDPLYRRLRDEAARSRRPATALAREAIDKWLEAQQRRQEYEAVAEYAREAAGTKEDLDEDLENAGVEELRALGEDETAVSPS